MKAGTTSINVTRETKQALNRLITKHADEIRAMFNIEPMKQISSDMGIQFLMDLVERSNGNRSSS